MGVEGSVRSVAVKAALWSSVVIINLAALFLVLNLTLWGYYRLSDMRLSNDEPQKAPMRYKKSNDTLEKLFPKLSRSEIDQLIFDSRHIVQEYDPYTQFKESPYKTKFVNVDVNGFRHTGNQGPWPPLKNDLVIFFFGGSTSFGYGVQDSETVASHLQEILNQRMGIPVKVYNFGRGAYFSTQERILFEKLLLDGYIPNVVIFLDGLNEFMLVDGNPGYTGQLRKFMRESDVSLFRKCLNEMPVVKFIKSFSESSSFSTSAPDSSSVKKSSESEPDILRHVIQRYQMNRKIVEAICDDFGIRSVFVWQPVPLYGYNETHHIFKDFDYRGFSPHVKYGYEFVSRVSDFRESGKNFIWLADIQKESSEPLYVSAFHYSPQMSQTVATAIADEMINRNLIPSNFALTPGIVSMSGTEPPAISVSKPDN